MSILCSGTEVQYTADQIPAPQGHQRYNIALPNEERAPIAYAITYGHRQHNMTSRTSNIAFYSEEFINTMVP